ncbi:MAG: Fructose-1,6-bisphosphate aldolase, class II [candidate division WWE3 bacterium GW2011_GWF2_41_45]|uniref:Tagatose-bisphosphate aldolase n=3 Tax=Katanobacteria TaxID=422282 RepID=A0A1F4W1H6_UNCKA|nr:MAG: Fructose-1,6-bisphosphate aldolase, class II [candidate division WWE3 bacterium GW2011_GWC2_41_23]KKS10343.1 MAG: Fructose-1,6-bisphosphate aldolase, class II [candidate division WWE3 bacterium GW2011_GWF2_41_45]KKS19731.1 MAG: Fructose-1,6-bisphosphate aldolase, class II [candidate division WWE3 bacterium GW2011_GWE1_41_72]KKS27204.1 MAG: fructose-1,6-bisphosphate aldolase, tagatose 1,6-diphosphate aldolase [candidate division WWE3 bacterium GW2011_GWC1_42_102]KKS30231.1 MAG: Fructose-
MKAKELLKKAREKGVAIGAFNVGNLETFKAITQAAENLKSPVLIEASPGEAGFIGLKQLVYLARAYEDQIQLPVILNLDHGENVETILEAIKTGFDYVHYDGSKFSYEENLENASIVVEEAHKKEVMVEGEIDHIEGSSADHSRENTKMYSKPELFTDPREAKEFVEKTGIDVFASFIGNLHGIYADIIHLNLDKLKEISTALPHTYLSLHGGSGVYDDDVRNAIKMGIVKVNVNSELRVAFKMTLQEEIGKTTEIAPYKYMKRPIEEVQKVVETKMKLFGSPELLK